MSLFLNTLFLQSLAQRPIDLVNKEGTMTLSLCEDIPHKDIVL